MIKYMKIQNYIKEILFSKQKRVHVDKRFTVLFVVAVAAAAKQSFFVGGACASVTIYLILISI